MRRQIKHVAAVLSVALAVGGLLGIGATPAQAAPIVQDGPVNYIGPGPCPAGTTDCAIAAGDVDVVQNGTSNTADCRGANCKAVQSGSTNKATCDNDATAATSDQRCEVSQNGSSNTITADLAATQTSGGLVSFANVTQSASQRFTTSQTGANNTLNVTGTINQSASSLLDAQTPVTHTQDTLIDSQNTMTASANNTANFTLNRTQSSTQRGAQPTSRQDTTAGMGLGKVRLVAKSAGTSNLKVRGNDTKTQNATSLNNALVTQTQGREGGGWLVDLSGTDTGTQNGIDVDLGTPGATDGIVKNWTQTAAGFLGSPPKDLDQIDEIRLPLLGLSPYNVVMNAINRLRSDEGGHQVCRASSAGHAKTRGRGKLACDMAAGTKVQAPSVSFDAQTWNVNVACEQNNDTCPGGTVTTHRKGVKVEIDGNDNDAGVIPVVILSQPNDNNPATIDDATTVKPSSVCFGEENEAQASQRDCTEKHGTGHIADYNGDGLNDLKLHYEDNQTGIDASDTRACLTGQTYGGEAVEGCATLPH